MRNFFNEDFVKVSQSPPPKRRKERNQKMKERLERKKSNRIEISGRSHFHILLFKVVLCSSLYADFSIYCIKKYREKLWRTLKDSYAGVSFHALLVVPSVTQRNGSNMEISAPREVQ